MCVIVCVFSFIKKLDRFLPILFHFIDRVLHLNPTITISVALTLTLSLILTLKFIIGGIHKDTLLKGH